ncbi:MAG: Family 10 glycosylhydrolase, partial [Candidatus Poribacteria bacterium]|nr:Family 10 glycosylhydrolase [Candidatus Poribacteria bacterium]
DDHHSTDGYRFPPIEFFRGVFGNWWQQGADSVVTFNWSNASPDICEKVSKSWGLKPYNWGPISHDQAYHEVGSPETLAYKDKFFAIERRGGYPWAEGFFGRNDDSPLPAILANDGRSSNFTLIICDNIRSYSDKISKVVIRAIFFGAREVDKFDLQFNGVSIPSEVQDYQWKDPQIFSPNPQPISGGDGMYKVNPEQKLLRLDFNVPSGLCRLGENQVSISIIDRVPYVCAYIFLEKLEIHVKYL